jgi:hypothetical protein
VGNSEFSYDSSRSAQTSNRQITEFAAAADWSRRQLQQQEAVVRIGDFNSLPNLAGMNYPQFATGIGIEPIATLISAIGCNSRFGA